MLLFAGETQKCFATRLRALREAAKLTQAELAEKLEVSRGSISYYEKMERVPDIVFLMKTAEYFGIDPSFMLGYSDNEDPRNGDIGARLNLTDQAIDFFEWHEEFGETLSMMIECELFERFWENCMALLYEENFRYYRTHDSGDIAVSAYVVDAYELENYRTFAITKIFTEILKLVREKADLRRKYGDLTENELKKILDTTLEKAKAIIEDYELTVAREKAAREAEEQEYLNSLSEEERLDKERRFRARETAEAIASKNKP